MSLDTHTKHGLAVIAEEVDGKWRATFTLRDADNNDETIAGPQYLDTEADARSWVSHRALSYGLGEDDYDTTVEPKPLGVAPQPPA